MSTPTTSPQPSLSCTRCGYDLRGLPREANCPECGTPLLQSVYGDYLRHQDPAWLRRLLRGAGWLLGGQVGSLALSGYWLARHGSYDWNVLVSAPVSGVALPLALTGLNLAAAFLLTAPAPHQAEAVFSPRRAVRIGTVVMAAMTLMGYLPAIREPPEPRFWLTFGVVQAAVTLLWGLFLLTVAVRVPNVGLAFETVLVAGATALVETTLYVLPWVAYAGRWSWPRKPLVPVGLAQLVLWGLGGYALVLLVRYYFALAAARETAASSIIPSEGA